MVELPQILLSRDFRRCSIFDFCDKIGAKRTFGEKLMSLSAATRRRYNRPSGDPTLSQAEIRMTKAIIDITAPCTITSSSARTGMPA
jgi:hypothetical protein